VNTHWKQGADRPNSAPRRADRRQCASYLSALGNTRKTISLSRPPMQVEQAEPRGVAQVDNILKTMDGLLALTNSVVSSSVRYGQSPGLYKVR